MPATLHDALPGDVIAVQTPTTIFSLAIRFGEWLQRKPSKADHIVIFFRQDAATGVRVGIEGRPGGVGYVDMASYDGRLVASNISEPKTDAQRAVVVGVAQAMLGVPYDWEGIVVDATEDLHLTFTPELLRDFGPLTPGHVVCSSLAAWAYRKTGLAAPATAERSTQPSDWVALFEKKGWA